MRLALLAAAALVSTLSLLPDASADRRGRRWNHERPAPGMSLEAAAAACNDLVYGSSDRSTCLQAVTSARIDISAGVAACGNLVYGSKDRLACVASVAQVGLAPAALAACGELVYGSQDRLTCAREIGYSRYEPVQLANFCAQSFYGSSDRLECVRTYR